MPPTNEPENPETPGIVVPIWHAGPGPLDLMSALGLVILKDISTDRQDAIEMTQKAQRESVSSRVIRAAGKAHRSYYTSAYNFYIIDGPIASSICWRWRQRGWGVTAETEVLKRQREL